MPTTSIAPRDPVGIVGRHGQAHVAAVASARDHHARRVEVRLARDPVEQRADVLDRVLALHAVVEREEGLAEARRAAHVGPQHGDAELLEEIVVAAEKADRGLALGPAVNVDQHRPLAGEARRRHGEQARDLAPVEARPANDLLLGERRHLGARRRVRRGPALHRAVGGVDHRDGRRRAAAVQGRCQRRQARMELQGRRRCLRAAAASAADRRCRHRRSAARAGLRRWRRRRAGGRWRRATTASMSHGMLRVTRCCDRRRPGRTSARETPRLGR